MTSLPDDGSSDANIRQIGPKSSSCDQLLVDTSSFPLTRGPESAIAAAVISTALTGVTPLSNSYYECIPQFTSPGAHETTRLTGQRTNNKGKGVECSLDWHMVTHDASESEREGKSLLPAVHDTQVVMILLYTELAYQLLASLPRSRLATVQRRIVPFLQFDLVGVSFASPCLFKFICLRVVSTTGIGSANIHVAPCLCAPGLYTGLQAMESPRQRSNSVAQSLPHPWLGVAAPTNWPFASAK